MAESIGVAYISVDVNTDTMQAGISRAKAQITGLSAEAQQQFDRADAATKRLAVSHAKYAQSLGMSRTELKALHAEQRIGGALGREIAASIRAQSAAQDGAGKTAREMQFAMRGLPAQLTDIFTSLAAGQNPTMVFLQQGGQLKDMFGGIGPAAAALRSSLVGMINPLTVTAAAAGVLALAWHQAEDEMVAFNRAIIQTGNFAGVSAEQLADVAAELDALEGVTRGSASEALAAVAATGRFTVDQLQMVTQAAEQMRVAYGKSIDETIEVFKRLEKDPVDALLKLNETEHFLTQAQLDRVRALQEEGREQEAATEAMRIYADVVDDRTADVVENLGAISGLWHDIKTGTAEAWDGVVEGVGKADRALQTWLDKLAASGKTTRTIVGALATGVGSMLPGGGIAAQALLGQGDQFGGVTATLTTTAQVAGTVDSEQERERRKAEEEFASIVEQNLSDQKKLEAEIAHIREVGKKAKADASDIEAQVAAVEAEFAEKQAKAAEAAQRAQDRIEKARRREAYREAKATIDQRRSDEADLRKLIAAEDEANQKFLELAATLSGPLAAAEHQHKENLAEIDRLGKAAGRTSAEIAELKRLEGEAYEEVVEKIERQSDEMSKFTEQAARNMQDAFADFLFDPFEDGLDGMLESFAKTLQRMAAEMAASAIFDSLGDWGKQNSGEDGFWGALASWASSAFGGATANAKGGVYDSPSLSAYSGGVYSSPQFFAFAKGAGVFGEAGPEAIMPLTRGADGKLGVTADGLGGEVNFKVEIINQGDPLQADRQQMTTGPNGEKVMRLWVRNEMKRGIASGELDGVAGQAWGVRRQGVTSG